MSTPITDLNINGTGSDVSGTLTVSSGASINVASGGTLQSAAGSTVDISLGTVTLPSDVTRLGSSIDLSTDVTGSLPWASVSKTGSSLADLATKSASSIDSGTLAAARMTVMVGDSGAGGTQGAVPAPGTGDAAANKYLKADGTWTTITGTNATQIQSVNVSATAPTDGYALVYNSSATQWEPQAQSGGTSGTKTYAVWTATDGQPPSSNYATLDTRNSIAVLDFDASTDESTVFVGIMPEGASLGSGLKIIVKWMATSATSGNVVWAAQIERCNTDLDTDSFDTAATATGAANGTSGIPTSTTITNTNIDSVTAGELYRVLIYRDADNGSDTMTGDAELIAVEIQSAA